MDGETLVTRKITRALGGIGGGRQGKLRLGTPDARRDWRFADGYVQTMWRMVRPDKADDFVVSTGEAHRVLEFQGLAGRNAEVDLDDKVVIDPQYFRPAGVDLPLGDASRVPLQGGNCRACDGC